MITVVVSVYNTGKYLEKSITSLLSQTYQDYEIILIDDGSTDGSQDTCDTQAARSPKIRLFHKENGGLSSARNMGIENARGDFIIFPDPDDWVAENYLEQLLAIRNKHDADLSICGHYFHENGRDTVWNAPAVECELTREEALELLMRPESFCGYVWNKLFDMNVIRENELRFDTSLGMAQDLHFCYRYFQFCDRIAYDPAPVLFYNRDTDGVTTYDHPLTQRKITGLQTYLKIAELAHDKYPKVERMEYAILCDTALQYIYFYYNSHMNEPETLKLLRGYLDKYMPYMQESDMFSGNRKKIARLAQKSPRAYFLMFQSKRKSYDLARKITGKK